MSNERQNVGTRVMENIKQNAGLTMALGVLVSIMGFIGISSPFLAGLSVTMMLGIALIIGGIGQLMVAVKASMDLFTMIMAALTVVLGGYMLANLGAALASLTIVLAAYLVVAGVLEAVAAFKMKPVSGWGWTLFSSIMSLILGIMIWNQFPLSGRWAVGVLVGAKLFFSGWTLIMLGIAARSAVKS